MKNLMALFLILVSVLVTSYKVQAQTLMCGNTIEDERKLQRANDEKNEKPLWQEFHIAPKLALGIGSLIMDKGQAYGNIKLFLARYGEDHAGMRFLGVGAVVSEYTSFSFSPVAINMNHWLLSIDTETHKGTVGVSLNHDF